MYLVTSHDIDQDKSINTGLSVSSDDQIKLVTRMTRKLYPTIIVNLACNSLNTWCKVVNVYQFFNPQIRKHLERKKIIKHFVVCLYY